MDKTLKRLTLKVNIKVKTKLMFYSYKKKNTLNRLKNFWYSSKFRDFQILDHYLLRYVNAPLWIGKLSLIFFLEMITHIPHNQHIFSSDSFDEV